MTRYAGLREWCDPVVVGLEHLPTVTPGGPPPPPILFVCNHTLLGTVDAALVVDAVYKHTGVLVRSLAHPALLEWGMSSPGLGGGLVDRLGKTVAAGGGVATPAWAWSVGGNFIDADGFPVDVVE